LNINIVDQFTALSYSLPFCLRQNINLLYELFLLILEFKEQLCSLLQFGSEAFYLFHHLLIDPRQVRLSVGNRSKLLVLALLGLELPLEFIML
jgi:hypothetical protein